MERDKCLGYGMNWAACAPCHGGDPSDDIPETHILYIIKAELLNRHVVKSQEQDNPSTWYSPLSSLQIIANVYHFSDIPHLAVPKGGLDPFFSKQQRRWCWETLRELEEKKNVSLDCIKHLKLELSHISAYLWLCVCVLGRWWWWCYWDGLASGMHPFTLGGLDPFQTTLMDKSIAGLLPPSGLGPTPAHTLVPFLSPHRQWRVKLTQFF